jgi:glucokinase
MPDYAVGVDVGGTKIAAAVIDPSGGIRSKIKLATEKQDCNRSIAQVAEAARDAVAAAPVSWDQICAVGVVIPGIYYPSSGNVWAPNLPGWDHLPLRAHLERQLPRPVVIDSDRSACVVGEQWAGIARDLTDVVFVAVGTGIGAGIITGGRLCRGTEGIAGAVGWFVVDSAEKSQYGQVGCLEGEAAGPGVARRAAEIASRVPSQMLELAGGCLTNITAETVVAAARRGDEPARQVLEETARYLGKGFANIVSILNPQMIVLGGGLMQAGDLLLEGIRQEMLRWAQPLAARQVRIELTQLGEDAGLLGAARLAMETDHVS